MMLSNEVIFIILNWL